MANETNQLPTPDEAPDHAVQDTSEFQEQGDQQQQQPKPQPKKEEAEEPGEKTYYVDQKRADIIANASKAKRDTSLEFTGSDSDPKVRYGTDVDESDLGELEQEALRRQREVRGEQQQGDQSQQQQQTQQQRPLNGMDPDLLDRQVKIIVNGQEQIITVEEALRRAQKIAAADDYFEQSKQTLREVKEFRHELARANQQGDNGGQPREDQQYDEMGEQRDTTALLDISDEDAEKLQMGTTEEVKATMAKLLGKAAAPAVPQVDVAQEVRNALELERTRNEVQAYAKQYPEFSDPRMQRTIAEFTQEAVIEDIIKSGITEEQFNSVLKTPELIKEFHRQARQRQMPGFRAPLELTKAGHRKAVEWRTGKPFVANQQQQQNTQGQNNPPLNLQQRQERKAQLHPQPQQRRQAPASTQQQNKTQDQARSGRFEQIKAARGQPT